MEPDEAEPLQAEVDSESAVEAVSVDEAESEPAMSAHDMFAQLASQEEASAEVETAEDHMDDGEAAEAVQEPPTMELVEDGHATDATVESESADETAADAARSAQEAFAELRRSMMQDAAAAHIAAEPEDHPDDTEAAPDVVDGDRDTTDVEEPIAAAVGDESADGEPVDDGAEPAGETVEAPVDEQLQAETVDVSTVDAAASAPEAPFGDVIEFPVSESDAESGEKAAGDADPSAIDDDQSQEATDVVVLPSNRKTQPQDSSDPKDLGGLVGAVQDVGR